MAYIVMARPALGMHTCTRAQAVHTRIRRHGLGGAAVLSYGAYIVMAYVIMAYVVMAYVVMAYVVMA